MSKQDQSIWQSPLMRGLRHRCPKCGEGKLFRGYLKPAPFCTQCQLDYSDLRAEDGPAWLTILISGHFAVPFLLHLEQANALPMWTVITVTCFTLLGSILLLLPAAKGAFMAGLWFTQNKKRQNESVARTKNHIKSEDNKI